jgi:Spy/CpxP family protein refolding chaperone
MNFKSLSLAAGAIALTLTSTAFIANAQNNVNTSSVQRYAQNKEWKKGDKNGKFEKLGLTEAQRTQISEIKQRGRSEIINNVLTAEQRAQLESSNQGGEKGRGFRQLNLTDAQKNQIKQIMESQKREIDGILTPEQRQKLQEMKQNRENRRNSRRPSTNQPPNS